MQINKNILINNNECVILCIEIKSETQGNNIYAQYTKYRRVFMKQPTTIFMKVALFIIVIPILSFFVFGLPWVVSGLAEVIPVMPYIQYLGFMGLYGAVVPFLFALYQVVKFLSYSNNNKAYSEMSVVALKNIKHSAITISVLYVIAMPLLYLMADKDDAPGILLFGLIVFSASAVTAFFAVVFGKKKS